MTVASDLLNAGLTVLNSTHAEPLTLVRPDGSSSNLVARVTRTPSEGNDKVGPQFTGRGWSHVFVAPGLVTPNPKSGDSFEDDFGTIHRIHKLVTPDEFALRCECRMSNP